MKKQIKVIYFNEKDQKLVIKKVLGREDSAKRRKFWISMNSNTLTSDCLNDGEGSADQIDILAETVAASVMQIAKHIGIEPARVADMVKNKITWRVLQDEGDIRDVDAEAAEGNGDDGAGAEPDERDGQGDPV